MDNFSMILPWLCLFIHFSIWVVCVFLFHFFSSGFWFYGLSGIPYIFGHGQIDEHVQREIVNHRSLKHPNIIRFKEVQCCFTKLYNCHLRLCLVVNEKRSPRMLLIILPNSKELQNIRLLCALNTICYAIPLVLRTLPFLSFSFFQCLFSSILIPLYLKWNNILSIEF